MILIGGDTAPEEVQKTARTEEDLTMNYAVPAEWAGIDGVSTRVGYVTPWPAVTVLPDEARGWAITPMRIPSGAQATIDYVNKTITFLQPGEFTVEFVLENADGSELPFPSFFRVDP